jgi:hypothetical protein
MSTKKLADATEYLGTNDPIELPEVMDGDFSLARPKSVAENDIRKLYEDESFLEDKLVIRLSQPANESDQQFATLRVNEFMVRLPRDNNEYLVKRKFVEVLARSKSTRIHQVRREINGEIVLQNQTKTVQDYPFELIKDPNPKGGAWLRTLLHEA